GKTRTDSPRPTRTVTAADGTCRVTFQPLDSEGGGYAVEVQADSGGLSRSAQAAFTIEGAVLTPFSRSFTMSALSVHDETFTLTNVGTLPLAGLSVSVTATGGGPVGVTVDDSSLPAMLPPGGQAQVTVRFDPAGYVGEASFDVAADASAASLATEFTASVELTSAAAEPDPVVQPGRLRFGAAVGGAFNRLVRIFNAGLAAMQNLCIVPPALPWLRVLGGLGGELAPGQADAFAVGGTVPDGLATGVYTDEIVIRYDGGEVRLPVTAEVTDSTTLDLNVHVTDDMGRPVAGAAVVFTLNDSEFAGAGAAGTVLSGVTDENGLAEFIDMLAGDWSWVITAPYHQELSGRWQLAPGSLPNDQRLVMATRPFEITMNSSISNDPVTLGQAELALVMAASPASDVMTDRPAMEYLDFRGGPLPRELRYLAVGPDRPFKENTSFSLHNLGQTAISDVEISVAGDLEGIVKLDGAYLRRVDPQSSIVISYQLDEPDDLVVGRDRIFDGAVVISWRRDTAEGDPAGRQELRLPVRLRVAWSDPCVHDGRPYRYVPYNGPWPTGPILYGQDFIATWDEGAAIAGAQAAGHDVSSLRLSQDVITEGQTVDLDLSLRNVLPDETISIVSAEVRTAGPAGVHFDVEVVSAPSDVLAAGQGTDARWRLTPVFEEFFDQPRQYEVSIELSYAIGGDDGFQVIGPQAVTINPPPELVIRYDVSQGADDGTVDIGVEVSNVGSGPAPYVTISAPRMPRLGSGAVLEDPAPAVFVDLGPGQTASQAAQWTIRFDEPPDISAVRSALEAGDTQLGSGYGALAVAAPVSQLFISDKGPEDIISLLDDILELSGEKVVNELNTLAGAYMETRGMLRMSRHLVREEIAAGAFNAFGQVLTSSVNLVMNINGFAKDIAEKGIEALKPGWMSIGNLFSQGRHGVPGAIEGFFGSLDTLLNTTIAAVEAVKRLEGLFQDFAGIMTRDNVSTQDMFDYLADEMEYYRTYSQSVTDQLARLDHDPTMEEVEDLVRQAAQRSGEHVTGLDALKAELAVAVETAEGMLETIKPTAVFPYDLLYDELDHMKTVLVRTGRGIGASEKVRRELWPHWYFVGQPGNWRPISLQSWDLGSVYDEYMRLNKYQVMQYDNFSFHWDVIGQYMALSLLANAHNALSLTSCDPFSAMYFNATASQFNAALDTYWDTLLTMKRTEDMTYDLIMHAIAGFILAHQYDTAGLWRLVSDFGDHVTYLVEHSPVDPVVTLDMESLAFPDATAREPMPFGLALGQISLTNTSDLPLEITPTVAAYAGGQLINETTGTTVNLGPGEQGYSMVTMVLPRSSLADVAGYDLEIYADAWDPASLSRSVTGPYLTHMYVGTEDELAALGRQHVSMPLAGFVGHEERFERTFTLAGDTDRFRLLLTHSDDADLDLHLYDADGRHVGFVEATGLDEAQIPSSAYSGSDDVHQVITVADATPGGQYRVEVVVNGADPEESLFAVNLVELPDYPAMMATSAETIDALADPDGVVDFTFDAMEWGSSTGITDLAVSVGPLADESGAPLPLADTTVELSADSIDPGCKVNATVTLKLGPAAADGSYSGEMVVTGRDAATGEPVSRTVHLDVLVDRTAPAPPVVDVTPNPADSLPLTVTVQTEPGAGVNVFVDGLPAVTVGADADGRVVYNGLVLAMGDHTVTATATDRPGNESQPSEQVVVHVQADAFAPVTDASLAGDRRPDGTFVSPAVLTLQAADEQGGSGLAATRFAIDDGDWNDYTAPLTIDRDGTTKVAFRSIDQAGNEEAVHVLYVTVDQTAPRIVSWFSAATHGQAGEALLEIPDDGGFSEPRTSGLRKLVVTFSEPIDADTFTPQAVGIAGRDSTGAEVDLGGIEVRTAVPDETTGVITFADAQGGQEIALPDFARYAVRITGVTDLNGNPLAGDDDRMITALAGDAYGDLRVNNT
ncbi:MAG: hypothetical protein J7M21_04700, partial [Planctomycetes bacterium]|nr:hypothetical protein [Planctomycetota bacterium]